MAQPAPNPEGGDDERALLRQLQWLHSEARAPVLLVIDQFEELLSDPGWEEGQPGEGARFLEFLQHLLSTPNAGVLVLATMRTDYLAPLQTSMPKLTGLARTETLEPIAPEDFGELISGPAERAGLTPQPGLRERLVNDSGGGDALPLLAFTLEKLWEERQKRGGPAAGPRGERWDLTVADYAEKLGGVEGSVSRRAKACWDPILSPEEEKAALREAFLEHLVTVGEDGRVAKRPARLAALPERSRPILQRLVDDRLLVSDAGVVAIAHEALLRTWEPLVEWIAEGRVELLQRLRVKRLAADLAPSPEKRLGENGDPAAMQRLRRQALEQLAPLASAGGGDSRAVQKEASEALTALLGDPAAGLEERLDGALLLALIGAEEPLLKVLKDDAAPVAVRRRAAESLGLLAKRCGEVAQRDRIQRELEAVLRGEPLDVRILAELDRARLDPARLQELVEETERQVGEALRQAIAGGQLPQGLSEDQLQQAYQQAVQQQLLEHLKGLERELWASGQAPGWAEHDARLPLLQGAARGLQLAMAADLPLLGSGSVREVPMLVLMALEEEGGLRIRTEVVTRPVWTLPLPAGEQLELVLIPEGEQGEHRIGSPSGEAGRDVYSQVRQRCEGVDVEAERSVRLGPYLMVRHPISQGQWRAVVEAANEDERGRLKATPATFRPEDLWERHGEPGALPVDSVSWNDCRQWLGALNGWLQREWPALGGQGEAPRLALPSESQWEVACRAGSSTPFHCGATLDPSWANIDGNTTYGFGRRGRYRQRVVPNGFYGVVNRWGLAELHGQLLEWCQDQWHRNPMGEGWPADGSAWEGMDAGLADVPIDREFKLLRGGSWISVPHNCRAAYRDGALPAFISPFVGFRPCCLLPPGSLLGS